MANLNLSKTAAQSASVLATGEWELKGLVSFDADGLLDFALNDIFVQGKNFIVCLKTFKSENGLVSVEFSADLNMKSIGEDPMAFVADYSDKMERAFHPALLAHLEKLTLDEKSIRTVLLRVDTSRYPNHEDGLGFLNTHLTRIATKNGVELKTSTDPILEAISYEIIA